MTDSRSPASAAKLHPFAGMWLATHPSGAVACAKVINGELLIPCAFGGEGKLTGHYYNCRVIGETLFSRFEQSDSASNGFRLRNVAPNETLKGGRWMGQQVTEAIRQDISGLSGSLPGMQHPVWGRILSQEPPDWAKKYFLEDWPKKRSV